MAIALEFCSIVVPVQSICDKLGADVYRDYYAKLPDPWWCDGHLFREGCMGPTELHDILQEWKERGFELLEVKNGEKHWKEVCVVHSHHGPSYPCDWIEYDPEENVAWLKGTERGPTVGPAGREVASKKT